MFVALIILLECRLTEQWHPKAESSTTDQTEQAGTPTSEITTEDSSPKTASIN
jgi:hypothetical protein